VVTVGNALCGRRLRSSRNSRTARRGPYWPCVRHSSSGSLAILTVIRRALSRVSRCAAARRLEIFLQAFCGLAEPWPCRGHSVASCSGNFSPCRIGPLSRFPIHPRETSPAPVAARSRPMRAIVLVAGRAISSGSLAMLAAMRRAPSRVSSQGKSWRISANIPGDCRCRYRAAVAICRSLLLAYPR
jgi:hypothetical protein